MENNFELTKKGLGMVIGQVNNKGQVQVNPVSDVKVKRLSNALGYRETKKKEEVVTKFEPYVSLFDR